MRFDLIQLGFHKSRAHKGDWNSDSQPETSLDCDLILPCLDEGPALRGLLPLVPPGFGIIVGLVNSILVALLKTPGDVIGILVSFTYLTVLIGGPRGQTLGQQAMGIRVISFETGGSIGYGRAFIRIFAAYLSVIVIFVGYFWMLWDRERQCWHDKLANDVVVPVSAYPLP